VGWINGLPPLFLIIEAGLAGFYSIFGSKEEFVVIIAFSFFEVCEVDK